MEAMHNEKERPLEEIFQELDQIMERIQEPDVTLEESFALYEKGMKDIRTCTGLLDRIEKKMLVLSQDGTLEDFDGAAIQEES